jgi:CheY-like chemotaxis protein
VEETCLGRCPVIKRAADSADVAGVNIASRLSSNEGSRATRRALVVGVDSATLRLCRDVLERAGLAVSSVDTGIAAVIAARENRPDLILMDGQLRDVPGREAIRWLRSNPGLQVTPVIFLAATTEDGTARSRDWPDPVLPKPVSPGALLRTLREVLK